MNLDAIRELIALMKENQLEEIDWESEGEHIRIKASGPAPTIIAAPAAAPLLLPAPGGAAPPANAPGPQTAAPPPAAPPAEPAGVVIKSPIVGVYYAAPGPDKPLFVQPGDVIDENTVICIIEAMKVMNEIKAEMRGTVRQLMVENNQSVEFGQPLMVIEPAAV